MSRSSYAEFLAFAVVLILIPGPDFAVVTMNTPAGDRRRGKWTALGVSSSNLTQGTSRRSIRDRPVRAARGTLSAPGFRRA